MGIADSIYSDTAGFGKLYALWSAIIGTLIGIILIIVSIIAFRHKITLTSKTSGVVNEAPNCNKDSDNNESCSFKVKLKATGETVNIDTNYVVNYKLGDKINTIYYNPDDTSKAALEPDNETMLAIILLIMGIFAIIIPWVIVWLTNHFKAFAAVEGAEGVYNIFRN